MELTYLQEIDKLKEELEIARTALIDKQYQCDRLEATLKDREDQIVKVTNLKSMKFSEEIDKLLDENQTLRKQLEQVSDILSHSELTCTTM